MTRRTLLRGVVAAAGTPLAAGLSSGDSQSHKLGIATTSYMGAWRPKDTLEFLEHCHALGAAGIQAPINGDLPKIRSRAEEYGMYIEAMVPMPKGSDTAAFEHGLKNAQAVGALALRSACLGSRRYETFTSLEAWQQHVAESHQSIEAALPLLERYKIPLGIENHKDWTADELVAIMKRYSNEYLGVCLDFGNNIALLDNPLDVIEKLTPFTVCTHLKNMSVEPDADGFLLSEVLLGNGYMDLPTLVPRVQAARPKARFSLEMITRDPLQVPCLLDKYWITFPERNGIYLARTLRFVNEHRSPQPLPRYSQLAHDEAIKVEQQNVIACLDYAHANLNL
ncbi:MAG: TIM barrel protein [Acidobacteriaceae bacterium]|nr:TIM barrel protein [Acidobacteriaceae bacterium]